MWTKELRFCLFSLIYDDLLGYKETDEIIDFDDYSDSIFTEYKSFKKENINLVQLEQEYDNYKKSKTKVESKLVSHLPDWTKTFEIVKAILFTFQIEKQSLKIYEKDSLVVSYIKFAEGYCVSTNVRLIHAVLSKLVDEK